MRFRYVFIILYYFIIIFSYVFYWNCKILIFLHTSWFCKLNYLWNEIINFIHCKNVCINYRFWIYCMCHVFDFTLKSCNPWNSGFKENPEFTTHNCDIAVAFMCIQFINTIFQTWLERTISVRSVETVTRR